MRFAQKLEKVALEILRSIIPDAPDNQSNGVIKFPPYISVHIRRGDFEQHCPGRLGFQRDKSGCFTPLTIFAEAVESVRQELLHSPSSSLSKDQIRNLPVIIFSDEPKRTSEWFLGRFHRANGTSETWWSIVHDELKWLSIDHEAAGVDTVKKWGYWYPILVDSVLMSNAVGFVGTKMSTYSLLAGKRVERWNRGPMRLIHPVIYELD